MKYKFMNMKDKEIVLIFMYEWEKEDNEVKKQVDKLISENNDVSIFISGKGDIKEAIKCMLTNERLNY